MNILFFGTGAFAIPILEKLAQDYNLALVVTRTAKPKGRKKIITPSAIEVKARELGLKWEAREKFDLDFIQKIKELKPLFFVVADFGKIIPPEILAIPYKGAINIHPSLLPKYRGASPIHSAILSGDKETGISIMLLDDRLDHGPLLAQKQIKIEDDETYDSLYKKLSDQAANFLIETLKNYLIGKIAPQVQDDAKATFTKKLEREDGQIHWKKSAREIERMIRAYHPWPGAFTKFKNKNLKILEAAISTRDYKKPVGDFFIAEDKKLAVQCGEDALILKEVQIEGKRRVRGEEFAKGYLSSHSPHS